MSLGESAALGPTGPTPPRSGAAACTALRKTASAPRCGRESSGCPATVARPDRRAPFPRPPKVRSVPWALVHAAMVAALLLGPDPYPRVEEFSRTCGGKSSFHARACNWWGPAASTSGVQWNTAAALCSALFFVLSISRRRRVELRTVGVVRQIGNDEIVRL